MANSIKGGADLNSNHEKTLPTKMGVSGGGVPCALTPINELL